MKRRTFIAGLGSAVMPAPSFGQQADRVRRIGVLLEYDETDVEANEYIASFIQGLALLGWTNDKLRIDVRWSGGSVGRIQTFAKELVLLQPDAIVASSTPVATAIQRETTTIPVLFLVVSDPIGAGLVSNLANPGRDLTGFANMEGSMAGKWLELLTEIAPAIRQAAIMFNPDTAPGRGEFFLHPFEATARSLALEPVIARVRSSSDIERAIASLAGSPKGGLIVEPDAFPFVHRAEIIKLTADHKVPAVYPLLPFAREGGLLSYGTDLMDIWRRCVSYMDRILRGAKTADLPVQLPVKFFMALNNKTAKALGVTVPPSIFLRVDEVIE